MDPRGFRLTAYEYLPMKVVVLGASGIIGQHMRLCVPSGVEPVFARRVADRLHVGVDITNGEEVVQFLSQHGPKVIVNLAGENAPDAVETNPDRHALVNLGAPTALAQFCEDKGIHYIHVSSQAVFSGEEPPYGIESPTEPVNEYGRQKLAAERQVRRTGRWTIVRPTFVLGVRPLPYVGRGNPLEQMLGEATQSQVDDRWFSPLFARDAARQLWRIATERRQGETIHLGIPQRVSRYDIARAANPAAVVTAVQHDTAFPDLAPRPRDTTYADEARYGEGLDQGLILCGLEWEARSDLNLHSRATEIALFLGRGLEECVTHLLSGFGALHAYVAADFRAAAPQGDDDLLAWYRETEAYIWELSAYHADPGFNYSGICEGIGNHLEAAGAKRVLCLGDGIGGLTLHLHREGFEPVYHDLAGSRTAEFAAFRFWMHTGQEMPAAPTFGWNPDLGEELYDAVISLDFLEHCVNVDGWVEAIGATLKPGGLFLAQNAFAIGSGPDGSIPMHLAENDRYEHDWLPLLDRVGFERVVDNWFSKS